LTKKEDELKFEDGLAKLENILATLERGEIGLEEAIAYFKEGSALYGRLQEKLKSAEGEVKIVLEDFEGKLKTEDVNEES